MAKDDVRIVFVRLETSDGKVIDVDIGRDKDVDAVFTSRTVVDNILIPYYERTSPEDVERIRRSMEEQLRKFDFFMMPHQAPCRLEFPVFEVLARRLRIGERRTRQG